VKRSIQTHDAPDAPGILSQAVTAGGFIFVAGQVHVTADGTLVDDTTEDQVRQIMENIAAILRAGNAGLEDIVKATVYVTDMSLMPELNRVYPTFFSSPLPAREAVCVKELPLGASIEISVIAFDAKKNG
jgi:2-iminobutanoate/2-iminopropanoate deaminase